MKYIALKRFSELRDQMYRLGMFINIRCMTIMRRAAEYIDAETTR